MIRYYRSC